ncbi:MAG: GyrI-like domain-containing protein [Spirochaetales bacterium]|nr:GyrI-like domain-containing protein [Spirochaetales bacterium]
MRNDTKNDWQIKIEKALIMLLDNLDSPANFHETAKTLASSPFHFHKQFKKFTGETLKTCLSRIRLEKSMVMIRDSTKSITEIAIECGYSNSEMLSKAIKKSMGLSPSQLRKQKSWHPLISSWNNFHYLKNNENKTWFYLNGEFECMKTKIIEFPEKKFYGYECTGDFWQLPKIWEKLHKQLSEKNLYGIIKEFMSVFPDQNPGIPQTQKRAYGGFVTNEKLPPIENIKALTIPAGLYAVTVHYGSSEEIGPVWDQWIENWLPNSGWKQDHTRPNYEWYQNQTDNPELLLTFLVTSVKK